MAPWFIERLKASAWHQLYLPLLPFTHSRSESINADSLKLQLLTARKKEWWPATADSLPHAVYLTTVKHTALVGIEPMTFRSWVRRATSCATETDTRGPFFSRTRCNNLHRCRLFDKCWECIKYDSALQTRRQEIESLKTRVDKLITVGLDLIQSSSHVQASHIESNMARLSDAWSRLDCKRTTR